MEHYGSDRISPVVEEELLIFLDVHQFMYDVKFDIEVLSINSMLTGAMKVELHTPSSKITNLTCLE